MASGVDLLFTHMLCTLRDRLFFNYWLSPKSAMSFPLAWSVLLPSGAWFWGFLECLQCPHWPTPSSVSWFLWFPGFGWRCFSPSSPLMQEMRIVRICPTSCCSTWMTVVPSSRASCKPSVNVLGTDMEVPQGVGQQLSRDMGSQLLSGGFAGVCAAVTTFVLWQFVCPLHMSAGFTGFVPHWWEWGGRSRMRLWTY